MLRLSRARRAGLAAALTALPLALAYRFDLAAGGAIVLVAVAAFFVSVALRRRWPAPS